jgi:peptide/nickel transport system permease protein
MAAGWRYVVRRLGIAVVLLFLLSIITFALYFSIPSDPAFFLVDPQHSTAAQKARARHELGADRPVVVQYERFVTRALRGDFGIAYEGITFTADGTPQGTHVGHQVIRAAAVTGWLAFGGAVLLVLLAAPAAALAASRVGSWLDRSLITFSLIGISLHPIVLGLILQRLFGNRWHIAPASGYCSFLPAHPPPPTGGITNPLGAATCGGPVQWATHMALPWLTFALFFLALYMRIIRVQLLEVLGADYVRAARAKGASEPRVLRRHALPNAFGPVISMLGMDIGTAIGIAVYVETVFQLPGLGLLTLNALSGQQGFDLPVILAIVLLVGAAIIVLNLIADLVQAAVDPTVSVRSRGRRARLALGRVA